MTPYAKKYVSKNNLEMFGKIKRIVAALPNIDLGVNGRGEKILLSCHMLTRALAELFPLKVWDGYFGAPGDRYEHSWLVDKGIHIVIDPYPVAVLGGPVLVVVEASPWAHLYDRFCDCQTQKMKKIIFDTPEFRQAQSLVTAAVSKTARKLGYA